MALAGFLLTAVVGGPAASAQTSNTTPETYVGTAAAKALNLQIANQAVSAGVTSTKVDSTLKAVAEGAGYLSPLGNQSTGALEVVGSGTKGSTTQTCAGSLPLSPPVSDLISAGAGCSAALAEVVNGLPHAVSSGKVAGLDVNLSVLTQSAGIDVGTLSPILDPVLGVTGGLEAALSDATGQTIGATATIQQVVTALVQTKTLALTLGDSVSETTVDGSKVTSVAKAAGGDIQLFPLGAQLQTVTGVEVKPIVEIIVGSAQASSTYDRSTGKSEPKFDPAIVTIKVNTPLTDNLGKITGYDLSSIAINPDLTPAQIPAAAGSVIGAVVTACPDAPNEFCILAGTPLETRIAVASGHTVTNPDGSVGAVADAVKVHALRNIGTVAAPLTGGILLELAHAEAGVGGKPASTVTVATPEIPRELPRTGGTPWIPMVGIAGVGIALATRRTIARAAR